MTNGASSAIPTNNVIITSPNTAALRLNKRRRARRAGLSSSSACAMGAAGRAASVMSLAPQPRIDEDVGDIGNQVQRDVDRRRHQHDALYDGVVAVEHGIHDQFAEAGNGEDL